MICIPLESTVLDQLSRNFAWAFLGTLEFTWGSWGCASPLALCALHVSDQRGKNKFFFNFYVSEQFKSFETHFFFKNVLWARNARERSEQDASTKLEGAKKARMLVQKHNAREREATENASAKPEGAKWPSSHTGLTWRGTKWLARLVYIIKEGLSVKHEAWGTEATE